MTFRSNEYGLSISDTLVLLGTKGADLTGVIDAFPVDAPEKAGAEGFKNVVSLCEEIAQLREIVVKFVESYPFPEMDAEENAETGG